MKHFHCSDVGLKCDFVATGNTNQEILQKAAAHAQKDHGMQVTPELAKKVESLIKDDQAPGHPPHKR